MSHQVSRELNVARILLSEVLMVGDDLHASLRQFADDTFGMHGPGAVFDGAKGKDKWHFDCMFGITDNIYRSQHGHLKQSGCDGLPSSRVAVVPKDFRSHRIICVEPKEFMFYQQGLMRVLVHVIHSHELTSRSIDFNDQSKSYKLSRSEKFATIDLSDASDNLRLNLARLIVPKEVLKLATVARSQSIVLPNGEDVEKITTLFTMGNGLCFPFQTLIFWSLVLATMFCKEHAQGTYSRQSLLRYVHKYRLRVFGDDIIIPKEYYDDVLEVLSLCGLKVNVAKSCNATPVREACGSWFYYGVDASIVRPKTHTVNSDKEWASLLQSAKLLYQNGFSNAGAEVLRLLHSYIPVPYGMDWVPGEVAWGSSNVRYNSLLQRVEVRVPIIKDNRPDVLTGEVGLYNYFVGRGSRMAPHHSAQRTEWGWVDRI